MAARRARAAAGNADHWISLRGYIRREPEFRDGISAGSTLGCVEGQNVMIEYRWARMISRFVGAHWTHAKPAAHVCSAFD
jgi:hypothetical protein